MSLGNTHRTVLATAILALSLPAAAEFSGTIGMGFKMESNHHKSSGTESEIEYDLLRGKVQHSALESWTFDYRIRREVAYDGNLSSGSKVAGDRGHSDNTYTVGAHYSFGDNWGIRFGYEYENKGTGQDEYTIAPDFSFALNDTTDVYAVVGLTLSDKGDSDADYIWYWAAPGISTQVGEDSSVALDFFYEQDRGIDDYDAKYVEWAVTPSYSTTLDNGMGLTTYAYFGYEEDGVNGIVDYEDKVYGIGTSLKIPVNARFDVKTGLAYERRVSLGANDDMYQPEFSFGIDYKI